MRNIGDRPLTPLPAPPQAGGAKPRIGPPTEAEAARVSPDARMVGLAIGAFEASPDVDLQDVELPDYANNATQSGTSGSSGTSRPGGRRAEAPAIPGEGQDFANNATQSGTSGTTKPPTRPGPRRADAGAEASIQAV